MSGLRGTPDRTITVFGAYGHTGRFVVAELLTRGWAVVLSGRDSARLSALGRVYHGRALRPARVDDAGSVDGALDGAAAVINCAGPFAGTAAPLVEAALRARIPYLGIAAEIEANVDTFEQYDARARETGIAIVPSMAFFGGLGDLLATAAMADWERADEISIAYALSSWKPTRGTSAASKVSKERRGGRRIVNRNQRFELRTDAAPVLSWTFPAPFGRQAVVGEFTTADSVTIPRHLAASQIHTYMTRAPLEDLHDPDPTPPAAIDASGRSAQTFLVEVVARSGYLQRRVVAQGRDIYFISAPIVVEAAGRVLDQCAGRAGVFAGGEIFDAHDFLRSLSALDVSFESEERADAD